MNNYKFFGKKAVFLSVAIFAFMAAGYALFSSARVEAGGDKKKQKSIFDEQQFSGNKVMPVISATEKFSDIIEREKTATIAPMEEILRSKGKRPRNPPAEEMPAAPADIALKNPKSFFDLSNFDSQKLAPQIASPSPNLNFQGLGDANTSIPPDTHGAVGPNHIMTALNTQVRIQSKTGVTTSTVTLNTFFASVGGGGGTFDPRVLYDRYQNRWICVAVDDAAAATSKMLIAVSQTNDPTGTWNFYGYDHDATNTEWADYPMVGFNKNWIAVSINDFTVAANAFSGANTYIFDKSTLYAGAPSPTVTKIDIGTALGNVHQPVETFDNTLDTLYVIQRWNSAGGQLRVYTITGTPAAPIFTATSLFPTTTGWSGTAVAAPQSGGGAITITNNDTRLQQAIYRNGSIWAAHTIFLTAPSRTSVQWWQFNPTNATVTQAGRIDDATATNFYAFPSIAVNAANQALVGYSTFSATTFASAGYAYRGITDATATMRDPLTYKAGLACYRKTFGGTTNRWGDYSNTTVDPTDDSTFWTLQEYAETAVGGDCTVNNTGRFGVWWAKVIPPCTSIVASGNWNTAATWGCGAIPTSADDAVIVNGQTVTLDVNPSAATIVVNEGGTLALSGNRSLSSNLLVNGTLNLAGGTLDTGANTITIGCGGAITGASATGYVIGNLKKDFCATGSFDYATGSANGYTPVNATVTALGANPSSLTIKSNQTTPPQLAAANSLKRNWSLTETGDVTVNLVFNYLDPTDIAGTESSYQLFRISGGVATAITPFTLNTAANTISVNGVSTFSDWAGGNLAPSAATATIRGKVTNESGRALSRATVTITDEEGNTRRATTNTFGNYRFEDIEIGRSYIVSVTRKGYIFNSQIVSVSDNIEGLNFIGVLDQ